MVFRCLNLNRLYSLHSIRTDPQFQYAQGTWKIAVLIVPVEIRQQKELEGNRAHLDFS